MVSLGGIPAINLPTGFDATGRPMGLQIMGKFGNDRGVLQFGLAYEQITNYLDRKPRLVLSWFRYRTSLNFNQPPLKNQHVIQINQ